MAGTPTTCGVRIYLGVNGMKVYWRNIGLDIAKREREDAGGMAAETLLLLAHGLRAPQR